MSNRPNTTTCVAAATVAAAFLLQIPIAGAAGDASAQGDPRGVPGVEVNVGDNASDRGLPGVEMNIGRDGDQRNIDTTVDTRTLGAGADRTGIPDGTTQRPMQADRG